ncbi:restriction endonuclease [Stutzerimonas nitrititolerans]|uniref:restriction endonuclease n=1 Tax=Stutzerimonas nitrititolerans TaxID=2482751 RepID=UPI002898FEC0|nr:restriction endonuclease [Stutzerimonas nitrititolerans]
MKHFPRVEEITPEKFELQVKSWLESSASRLESFSTEHRKDLKGHDGEYEIDVVARFRAFAGAEFLMIVECKKHKNPIKREVVQAIRQKQLSLGAHKAMVVSTAKFQSGAIEFARNHGVSLVQLISGAAAYIQAAAIKRDLPIPESAEDYAGIFYGVIPKMIPQPFTAKKNYGLAGYLENL